MGEKDMVSSDQNKSKRKELAEESHKLKRAREKLKRQLEATEHLFTSQALEQKAIEIQRWISRHSDGRISLKNKSIALFDENQNAAELSERVSKIAIKLRGEKISE
jgi:hypothetical protein